MAPGFKPSEMAPTNLYGFVAIRKRDSWFYGQAHEFPAGWELEAAPVVVSVVAEALVGSRMI